MEQSYIITPRLAILESHQVSTMTLPYFFLLVLSLLSSSPATADMLTQVCGKTGNYTSGSAYQTNLNHALLSLSLSTNTTFSSAISGAAPDQVSALSLCRGDTTPSSCRSCLSTAIQDAPNICPYAKEAVIWYDNCLIRYSNQHILSSSDFGPQVILYNTQNATNPSEFDSLVAVLLGNVSSTAGRSEKRFATGEAESEGMKVYGLAQCTTDLTAGMCGRCLNESYEGLPKGMMGARMIGVRCNVRYETYEFFDGEPSLKIAVDAPPAIGGNRSATTALRPTVDEGKKKNVAVIVLAVAIPCGAAIIISLIFFCFWRRRSKTKIPDDTRLEEITSVESILFDLSMLKTATANFSDASKLGQGGFGAVYKGTLPNRREIAVKRLASSSSQGLGELKNELVLVAKLQHRNLVRLLGICLEEQEKILVYEYLPNRSLDTFLFDPIKCKELNWAKRYKIIGGIARGLVYLHEDSQLKIIHRDLKASNILLDADMNAKISDFGLARLFGGEQTQGCTSRVVGTFGYMAPEYAMRGNFSIKSDVFSFGVLVLEILTGRKNTDFNDSENSVDLLSYTWEHWTNGAISEIIDPNLGEHCPRSEVLRCIQIGLLCVQEDPANRPNMSTVVLMLDSYSVSLQAPSTPAFYNEKGGKYSDEFLKETYSYGSTRDESFSKPSPMSPNEVTISEIVPR